MASKLTKLPDVVPLGKLGMCGFGEGFERFPDVSVTPHYSFHSFQAENSIYPSHTLWKIRPTI
jgi:hypothetical protein